MNDLIIFNNPEFGKIRTINEDGKVLFCGADVARALGYAKPQNAIASNCKGALKRGTPTKGGEQEMIFIPESDLYRLVFRSKLPTAEKFTDWVTEEVLPSIRRKGYYSVLPDEQLAKALISALGDEWKLENVIIPALRQGYDEQGVLVAKYMGMDIDELLKNSKLMKKSSENHLAKTRIAKWFGAAFTMNDIPEEFKDTPEVFMAIAKTRKKRGCDEWFADYCGETYFNLYAYEEIIDYLKNCGVVTPEYADKWKREIKLESAGRKKVIP